MQFLAGCLQAHGPGGKLLPGQDPRPGNETKIFVNQRGFLFLCRRQCHSWFNERQAVDLCALCRVARENISRSKKREAIYMYVTGMNRNMIFTPFLILHLSDWLFFWHKCQYCMHALSVTRAGGFVTPPNILKITRYFFLWKCRVGQIRVDASILSLCMD